MSMAEMAGGGGGGVTNNQLNCVLLVYIQTIRKKYICTSGQPTSLTSVVPCSMFYLYRKKQKIKKTYSIQADDLRI